MILLAGNYDYLFKVVMLGDEAVGKTSIIIKYTQDRFIESYKMTLGADFSTKVVSIEGVRIGLGIWDLGGQYRFRELRRHYYANAAAGLLLFDITRPDTFLHIDQWINEFRNYASGKLILIGNKIDMSDKRLVPPEAGEMISKWLKIPYIETSAKTGENVEYSFKLLAKMIYKQHLQKIT